MSVRSLFLRFNHELSKIWFEIDRNRRILFTLISSPFFGYLIMGEPGFRLFVWLKSRSDNEVILCLSAFGALLYIFAALFGSVVMRNELDLHSQSITDPLTGLPNRRLFMKESQRMVVRAKREKLKLAVYFIDLRNFKSINDAYGHDFGDEVLKEVSRLLLESFREGDLVARMGGDEFVVMLDAESENFFHHACKRLRDIIGEIPFEGVDAKNKEISISITNDIGYAIGDSSEFNILKRLLREADADMYAKKQAGK